MSAGVKRSAVSEIADIPTKVCKRDELKIFEVNSACKKALVTYRVDLKQVQQDARNDVFDLIHLAVKGMKVKLERTRVEKSCRGIKFVMVLNLNFIKPQIYMK